MIEECRQLQFHSEEDILEYFQKDIAVLENEFLRMRPKDDIGDQEAEDYLDMLEETLDSPDEVWEDSKTLSGQTVYNHLKRFDFGEDESVYYVAVTCSLESAPTFIYLHFPTRFYKVADRYRRSEIIFDRVLREVERGAIEGDALCEGDELAVGLYKAMVTLRGENDITDIDFTGYSEFREQTIYEPDEIWRSSDYSGQVLVNFIREFEDPKMGGEVYYIVVTIEEGTNSQILLFSFPTKDISLVERYRQGENLQAEEAVQEASH